MSYRRDIEDLSAQAIAAAKRGDDTHASELSIKIGGKLTEMDAGPDAWLEYTVFDYKLFEVLTGQGYFVSPDDLKGSSR